MDITFSKFRNRLQVARHLTYGDACFPELSWPAKTHSKIAGIVPCACWCSEPNHIGAAVRRAKPRHLSSNLQALEVWISTEWWSHFDTEFVTPEGLRWRDAAHAIAELCRSQWPQVRTEVNGLRRGSRAKLWDAGHKSCASSAVTRCWQARCMSCPWPQWNRRCMERLKWYDVDWCWNMLNIKTWSCPWRIRYYTMLHDVTCYQGQQMHLIEEVGSLSLVGTLCFAALESQGRRDWRGVSEPVTIQQEREWRHMETDIGIRF